jgi:excisionase family DNA binding protein
MVNSAAMDTETWDAPTTAAFLKCSRNHLLRLAQEGAIPAAKIGRCWIFSPSKVRAWLDARMNGEQKQ